MDSQKASDPTGPQQKQEG
jgi:spore coat protein CotH